MRVICLAATRYTNSSNYDEWQQMAGQIKKKYPLASKYLGKVRTIFEEFDKDKDDKLTLNECAAMFETLSKKVTSLPAVSGRVCMTRRC